MIHKLTKVSFKNYRQELKERREQLLGTGSHSKVSSHKSDDRDKRKKKKKSKVCTN